MVYKFDNFSYIIRFEQGESLMDGLQKFAAETKLEGGWINGLGGALKCELGYYDLTNKQYNWKQLNELLEVVSLQGNIAKKDGEHVFHIHGVFSDDKYNTVGGHVKDLITGATLELYVNTITRSLTRKTDPTTGLNILDL